MILSRILAFIGFKEGNIEINNDILNKNCINLKYFNDIYRDEI